MSDSFVLAARSAPPPPRRRKVLVTGASGNIGSYFAARNARRYDLRLMVRGDGPAEELEKSGEVVRGSLEDIDALKRLCSGIDTIMHLAADAQPDASWDSLLQNNIIGSYNLFIAAAAAGCRRVVYASSIHAVSGYPAGRQVHADDPVNPGDLYGVSKCFGEAMGRFMATQRGLSVIAIRIGAFQPLDTARDPGSVGLLDAFVSRDDLDQLLCRCIDDDSLQFAIVHGSSNNAFNRMDISESKELLGYEPRDDFAQHNPLLRDLNLAERQQHRGGG